MGQIEWGMWANEQALISAVLILAGGIIGVATFFKYWQFAATAIGISVVVILFEYPRGKRKKGSTQERRFQNVISPLVTCLSPVSTNYFVRGFAQLMFQNVISPLVNCLSSVSTNYSVRRFAHLIFGVPCCFLLPTIIGGLCLMISGIIYIVAASKGESWAPLGSQARGSKEKLATVVTSEPPSRPAPRLRSQQPPATQVTQ